MKDSVQVVSIHFVLIKYHILLFCGIFTRSNHQSRKKTPEARNVVTTIATATIIAITFAPLLSLLLCSSYCSMLLRSAAFPELLLLLYLFAILFLLSIYDKPLRH